MLRAAVLSRRPEAEALLRNEVQARAYPSLYPVLFAAHAEAGNLDEAEKFLPHILTLNSTPQSRGPVKDEEKRAKKGRENEEILPSTSARGATALRPLLHLLCRTRNAAGLQRLIQTVTTAAPALTSDFTDEVVASVRSHYLTEFYPALIKLPLSDADLFKLLERSLDLPVAFQLIHKLRANGGSMSPLLANYISQVAMHLYVFSALSIPDQTNLSQTELSCADLT